MAKRTHTLRILDTHKRDGPLQKNRLEEISRVALVIAVFVSIIVFI
jgi:hypothetical protein